MKNHLWQVDTDKMKNLTLIFTLLSFTSCSIVDIDYHMPMTKFDTSETIGSELLGSDVDYRFQVQSGIGATHKVTLAEVIDPIIFNERINEDSSIDNSAHLNASAALAIIPRLDITYRKGIDSPDMFGIKFQFLGQGEVQRKEGWSGSVTAKIGGGEKDEGSIIARNSTSSDTRSYAANIDFKNYESSLIFGYRVNKSSIFYLNNFYTYYDVTSNLTSSTYAPVEVNGISRQYGSLLGAKFISENDVFLILEGGLVKATWENTNEEVSGSYGLSLGVSL